MYGVGKLNEGMKGVGVYNRGGHSVAGAGLGGCIEWMRMLGVQEKDKT